MTRPATCPSSTRSEIRIGIGSFRIEFGGRAAVAFACALMGALTTYVIILHPTEVRALIVAARKYVESRAAPTTGPPPVPANPPVSCEKEPRPDPERARSASKAAPSPRVVTYRMRASSSPLAVRATPHPNSAVQLEIADARIVLTSDGAALWITYPGGVRDYVVRVRVAGISGWVPFRQLDLID